MKRQQKYQQKMRLLKRCMVCGVKVSRGRLCPLHNHYNRLRNPKTVIGGLRRSLMINIKTGNADIAYKIARELVRLSRPYLYL